MKENASRYVSSIPTARRENWYNAQQAHEKNQMKENTCQQAPPPAETIALMCQQAPPLAETIDTKQSRHMKKWKKILRDMWQQSLLLAEKIDTTLSLFLL